MIDGIAYKPDVIIGYAKSRNEEIAVMTDLIAALMFMTPIFDVGQSEQAVVAFNHLGYPLCLRPFKGGASSFIMGSNSVGARICSATSRGICFDASR